MDRIMTGLIAGGIIGAASATYAIKDLNIKKKAADNKKVERREGGMI